MRTFSIIILTSLTLMFVAIVAPNSASADHDHNRAYDTTHYGQNINYGVSYYQPRYYYNDHYGRNIVYGDPGRTYNNSYRNDHYGRNIIWDTRNSYQNNNYRNDNNYYSYSSNYSW